MEKFFRLTTLVAGLFVVVTLIHQVTENKLNKLKDSQLLSSPDVVTIKTRERQLECLAMNVYREAGGENFEGKVAVAQVVLNRAANPKFPNDICAVVYQKTTFVDKVVCQFSWYCEGAPRAKPTNTAAYNESMAVAKKVLLEGFKLDILKDALYFHAVYVDPKWPHEKIGKIGNHVFYRSK